MDVGQLAGGDKLGRVLPFSRLPLGQELHDRFEPSPVFLQVLVLSRFHGLSILGTGAGGRNSTVGGERNASVLLQRDAQAPTAAQ
jgi:hypothetical protein